MQAADVCGRPGKCKKFYRSVSMWSGADVCPASMCGFSRAAGLYGDVRIGSNTLTIRSTVLLVPISIGTRQNWSASGGAAVTALTGPSGSGLWAKPTIDLLPLNTIPMAALGPFRRFAAAQQVGSYRGLSGGALLGVSLSEYDP